jgi:hypothetical protein
VPLIWFSALICWIMCFTGRLTILAMAELLLLVVEEEEQG